jgi:hypothetical protein
LKVARTIGKGGRVEVLVRGILDDLQLLAMNFPNITTPRHKEELATAIKQVSKLAPSLPDGFEDTRSFSQYGKGF